MSKMVSSAEIGQKIRSLRLEAGLTQERLAEIIGVSHQQVQKYENGTTRLTTDKLQMVANALSVEVTAFFGDKPDQSIRLSNLERELITSFRQIKDTEIQSCFSAILSFSARKIEKR